MKRLICSAVTVLLLLSSVPQTVMGQSEEKIKEQYISLTKKSAVVYELVDLGLSVKWGNVNMNSAFENDKSWSNSPIGNVYAAQWAQLDEMGYTYFPYWKFDSKEWLGGSPNNRAKDNNYLRWYFEKNAEGKVVTRLYEDSDWEYAAGGPKHGQPHSVVTDDLKKALLLSLKHKPNPSLSTPQAQAEWVTECCKIAHYPTKAEWQELMDNCTVSGVESNPVRSHPITKAFYEYHPFWRERDDFLNRRMLRLTSKINGNSIVLPFDARGGTNYATSQYLSSDPRFATCVHVDSTGLSFVEVKREKGIEVAHRIVFGVINMDALKSDIQQARSQYASSPYALEQEQLKKEYDEPFMSGVLSIGAPTIEVKSKYYIVIKAPVTNGVITDKSLVRVAIDYGLSSSSKDDIFHLTSIIPAQGEKPAYVMWSGEIKRKDEDGEPIDKHNVIFLSDNIKEMRKLYPQEPEITSRYLFEGFLRIFYYKYKKSKGFNNCFDWKTNRRIIVTPMTYFRIDKKKSVEYISGPRPEIPLK